MTDDLRLPEHEKAVDAVQSLLDQRDDDALDAEPVVDDEWDELV